MLSTIPKDKIQGSHSIKFILIIDFIMLCISFGIVTSDSVNSRRLEWESKILLSQHRKQVHRLRDGRAHRRSPRASRNRLYNRT